MGEEECSLFKEGYSYVAGVDEAGCGALAGPVVAACCMLPLIFDKKKGKILDPSFRRKLEGLKDSKKLSPKQRLFFFNLLTQNPLVKWEAAFVMPSTIDSINILQARLLAMQWAIESFSPSIQYALIDGNYAPPKLTIPTKAIVKGDSLVLSIMAAAVIAKVLRDEWMCKAAQLWKEYGFASHFGYGVKKHFAALQLYGPCSIHRKSFLKNISNSLPTSFS